MKMDLAETDRYHIKWIHLPKYMNRCLRLVKAVSGLGLQSKE
jgi:hypothetical protein